MATTGNVTISGSLNNTGISTELLGAVITFISGIYAVTPVVLGNGNNTVTVPTGATLAIIEFPAGNTNAKTLKGVNGDTGIALNPAGVNVLQLAAAVASFVINSTGADTAATIIKFV